MTGQHTSQSSDHPNLITRYLQPKNADTLTRVTKKKPTPRETLIGFGILGVLAVLFCCGGITAIGALGDSGKEGDKDGYQVAAGNTSTTSPASTTANSPTANSPTVEPTTAKPTPKPTPTKTASKSSAPKSVYYSSCTAVRSAGKAPLRKGQPGYRAALDRDRDGRACESSEGPAPGTEDEDADGGSTSVYYKNCTAVRAAGKAPIYRGQPGYGRHLDRDGDGKACE